MSAPLLRVHELAVSYADGERTVRAVDGVDLEVAPGEFVGVAGESGCGKSTLALAIPMLLPDTARVSRGGVEFEGRELTTASEGDLEAVRWRGISMVFQGAMNALNPVHTVGRQIAEPIRRHDPTTSRRDARARAAELLEAVGIPARRSASYPHEFSGGMRQRVMIAMALACGPRLVIADEPITALDVMTQAQVVDLLRRLCDDTGTALLMISHDLSVLAETCDRVVVMYAGRVAEVGPADAVFATPEHPAGAAHPYTRRLLAAYPNIAEERRFVDGIPGSPPDLAMPVTGCRFAPRCTERVEVCELAEPAPTRVGAGHDAACHLLTSTPAMGTL